MARYGRRLARVCNDFDNVESTEAFGESEFLQVRGCRAIERVPFLSPDCRRWTPESLAAARLDFHEGDHVADTRDDVDFVVPVWPHTPSEYLVSLARQQFRRDIFAPSAEFRGIAIGRRGDFTGATQQREHPAEKSLYACGHGRATQ